MNKLYSIIFLFFVAFAFCGCTDENIGAEYSGKGGFAFASSVLNVEAESNRIIVPIYRSSLDINNTKISFSISDEEGFEDGTGIFSLLTEEVTFPDNSYESNAQVYIKDLNLLSLNGKYRLTLGIKENATPSKRDEIAVTVNRKLTFEHLGKCSWFDQCIFDNAYDTDIYKAKEADIYRVIDPYREGLIAEEYAMNGWMGKTPEYVQFRVDSDNFIHYEEFYTGMLVNTLYMAWAYYPSTYVWGQDFSKFDVMNKKISDTEFNLYPVYCLPDFKYGFLNEGAYPLNIVLK